jgi:hypothetical protein
MPRWVKWPALVLGLLVLILVGSRLAGIQHGPGMHMPDQPAGTHAPSGGHR